jgi:hypothetical protein
MQSGKSEVARVLVEEFGFTHLSFATPVKRMVAVVLEELGYSDMLVRHLLSEGKEDRLVLFDILRAAGESGAGDVTARTMMQSLGTDWGRELVHPSLWVRPFDRKLLDAITLGNSVVVDDMRFPNEYDYVATRGGVLVEVTRPNVHPTNRHRSEGQLRGRPRHHAIVNEGSLNDLKNKARRIITKKGDAHV